MDTIPVGVVCLSVLDVTNPFAQTVGLPVIFRPTTPRKRGAGSLSGWLSGYRILTWCVELVTVLVAPPVAKALSARLSRRRRR